MSVSLKIHGLDELRAALRALPAALAAEAEAIVTRHAEAAAESIRATYDAHRVTGNLAKGVSTRSLAAGRFGVAVQVRSSARHVHFFERGTEVRHYITQKNGTKKLVGRMPALPTFVPAMRRERAAMWAEIAALLSEHGLTVTGFENIRG